MRTAWSLIVIPRSRSRSIVSRTWSCMSRWLIEPVRSSSRSASVDLPWSMWAMMQKFRTSACLVVTAMAKMLGSMDVLLTIGFALIGASTALMVKEDFVVKHVTSKSLGSLAPGYAATHRGYYTYAGL